MRVDAHFAFGLMDGVMKLLKRRIYEILHEISDYTPEQIASWKGFTEAQVLEVILPEHIHKIVQIQAEYLPSIGQGIDGIAGNDFYRMVTGIRQKVSAAKTDLARIDDLLTQLEQTSLRQGIAKALKTSMLINTYLNRQNVRDKTQFLPSKSIDIVAGVMVGNYSAGCQVFFDTEVFYRFWTNLMHKAEASGQRRWYYNLVDVTDFKESPLI